ncbi:MAG: hypothetical protein J0I41_24415 [Filimonas sp.]|nr:hypothetical protein [Filimonas sp.]
MKVKYFNLGCFAAIVFCCITPLIMIGQVNKTPINVPSPNAFEFVKYGNTPVSYFNGQPSINIPLDNEVIDGTAIAASLNYDASGFRPDAFPGWVGMNWNLNIGGVVSRRVRGLPDEFNFSTKNLGSTYYFPNGFLGRKKNNDFNVDNLLKTYSSQYTGSCGGTLIRNGHILPYLADQIIYMAPVFSGVTFYGGLVGEFWMTENSYSFDTWKVGDLNNGNAGGIQDMYPDEFTFNAFGINGKFYFKKPGKFTATDNPDDIFAVQCDQKVTILPFFDYSNDTIGLNTYQIPVKATSKCSETSTTQNQYNNYNPWGREGRYPRILTGFSIKTENGMVLTFGKYVSSNTTTIEYFKSLPIEISADLYNCNGYWTADSWFLSSVQMGNGKRVSFEYERGGFIATKYRSYFETKIGAPLAFNCFNSQDFIGTKTGRVISPVYLKTVVGENFKWEINRSLSTQLPMDIDYFKSPAEDFRLQYPEYNTTLNQRPEVDNIVFRRQEYVKTIKFNYNNSPSERLMLNSVDIMAGTGNDQHYAFSYIRDMSQPAYLSDVSDHWGFWNGVTVAPSDDDNAYFTSRGANFNYTKQFLLEKITYPTGGSTSFLYEPNVASKKINIDGVTIDDMGTNQISGGVRVKEITDDDVIATVKRKKRFYYIGNYASGMTEAQINAGSSSGIQNSTIIYHWQNNSPLNCRKINMNYSGNYCSWSINNATSAVINVWSSQPLYMVNDNYHISYSKVYEVEADNSYTMNEFTNHDNGYGNANYLYSLNTNFESPFNKVTNRAFERGKPLAVKTYSNTNALLSEKKFSYTRKLYADASKNGFSLWDGTALFAEGCGYSSAFSDGFRYAIIGNKYSFETYQFLLSQQKDIVYDQNNSSIKAEVTNDMFYEGATYPYLTKVVKTTSNGDVLTTIQKYAQDYAGEFMLNNITNNKPATVVEKISLKRSALSNVDLVTHAELSEYGLSSGTSMPWLNSVYNLETSKPFPYSEFVQTIPITRNLNATAIYAKDARYKPVINMTSYDAYQNPLEIFKRDGLRDIVVRGNRSNNIIAIGNQTTSPSSYAFWAHTSFEKYNYYGDDGSITQEWDNSSDFSYQGSISANAFTGTNSFVGIVKPYKIVWGEFIYVVALKGGSIPSVEYLNGSGQTTSATSFTKMYDIDANWTLYRAYPGGGVTIQINSNGNSIDELRMSPNTTELMSTYSYKNGLLMTVTDKNFKRLFYEYDGFQRLKLIRDQEGNIVKQFDYKYQGQ